MNLFRVNSIKRKITSIIILSSSVALFTACLAFILYDRYNMRKDLGHSLYMLAKIIGQNSTAALCFNDANDAAKTLSALRAEKNVIKACILDQKGKLFATYTPDLNNPFINIPHIPDKKYVYTKHDLHIAHEIVLDDEIIGTVYIKADLSAMNRRLKQYVLISGLFVIASIIVVTAISLWLQKIISEPVSHLTKVAREVSIKKDYSIRALSYSKDELGQLARIFNEMLIQIQERDSKLQDTYQELKNQAHELKSELIDRRIAEQRIKDSLKEKEVLLREIHHRVKNNLQVISSLIYLQAKNLRDVDVLKLFKESQNRIKSMSLIHEELYNSNNLTQIDFHEYIKNLTKHLFYSYGEESKFIRLKLDVKDISLNIDTAINCGVIINELLSNSLKYAFNEQKYGEIYIKLDHEPNGNFLLIVKDDGAGIPETLDFRNTKSLGLQLVCNLVDQLNGTIDLNREHGTEFTISFSNE